MILSGFDAARRRRYRTRSARRIGMASIVRKSARAVIGCAERTFVPPSLPMRRAAKVPSATLYRRRRSCGVGAQGGHEHKITLFRAGLRRPRIFFFWVENDGSSARCCEDEEHAIFVDVARDVLAAAEAPPAPPSNRRRAAPEAADRLSKYRVAGFRVADFRVADFRVADMDDVPIMMALKRLCRRHPP